MSEEQAFRGMLEGKHLGGLSEGDIERDCLRGNIDIVFFFKICRKFCRLEQL